MNYSTKRIVYIALILMVFMFGPANVEAANHYIRAGATGANNGSSWADAWTDMPSGTTYIRGDEYYVAAGAYRGGGAVSSLASGATLIKICKATVSTVGSCATAHGSETGWSNSYGTGQAVMSATEAIFFLTDNWILDGVEGSGSNVSAYGFHFSPDDVGTNIKPVQFAGSNIQIKHTAATCPGSGRNVESFGFSGYGARVAVSYAYVDNCQVSMFNRGDDNTIENSWFSRHWSTPEHHGVHVEQVLRPIFRNNVMTYCGGPCIEAGDSVMRNGQYYNNVFLNVASPNGVLKGTSFDSIIDTVMYGNTMINSSGPILYQNNAGLGHGSGNTVVNNLFYNCPSGIINQADGGPIAHSYNALFDSGSIAEIGVQIGTGNPFVDFINYNFNLSAATANGQPLPSPFDVDMFGTVRGSDGVWDRGAIEFTASPTPTPIPSASPSPTPTPSTSPTPTPSDTTPPSISVTSPTSGFTISGSVSLEATASDNTGVTGVQFLLDGIAFTSELTSSPYRITWDTTTASDGSHTLTAIAHDALGNQTTSSGAIVTVSNSTAVSPTAPTSEPVLTPTPPTTPSPIHRPLYRGTKGDDVKTLQTLLIQKGHLPLTNDTGFFGLLTRAAVQKYQCAQNIVCGGTESSTGYGVAGPKTVARLNGGTITDSSSTSNLTPAQADAIISILQSFNADASVIASVRRALGR